MNALDLDRKFGEGWCITLSPLRLADTMHRMGVARPETMPDALQQIEERTSYSTPPNDGHVLLAGRQLPAGWSLVVEREATYGWVGARPDVLAALCLPGRHACTVYADPNQTQALVWEAGPHPAGIDPETGRRWGPMTAGLSHALTQAGFSPDGSGRTPALAGATRTTLAVLAARTATGVHLTEDDFTGPWTGGLSPRPQRPA